MAGRQLNTDLVIYDRRASYQQQFRSVGHETSPGLPLERDRFPHYANRSRRAETFYGQILAVDGDQACDAGLFHTGDRDVLQCYKCGVTLYNWENRDDPMKVHACYSPQCQFIILTKGEQYIKRICRTESSLQGLKEKCRVLKLENGKLMADNTRLHADKTKLRETNTRLKADNAELHRKLVDAKKQIAHPTKKSNKKPGTFQQSQTSPIQKPRDNVQVITSLTKYTSYNGVRPKEKTSSNRNATGIAVSEFAKSQESKEQREVDGSKPKRVRADQGVKGGLVERFGDTDLDITEPKRVDTSQSAMAMQVAEGAVGGLVERFGDTDLDITEPKRVDTSQSAVAMQVAEGTTGGLVDRFEDRDARNLYITEPKYADTSQPAVPAIINQIAEESCIQMGYAKTDIDRVVRTLQDKGKLTYSAEEIVSILEDLDCPRQLEDGLEEDDRYSTLKLDSLDEEVAH